MMRIAQGRLQVLDRISGGRVSPLVRRGEKLKAEIDAIAGRLRAHQEACWLFRCLRSRKAEADRHLMMTKRQEAALLTCEMVGIIAETKVGGYGPPTRSESQDLL